MSLFKPQKRKKALGIYIHVPFCRSKCAYCDFYSLTQKDDKVQNGYLDAICDHIREAGLLAPDYLVINGKKSSKPSKNHGALHRGFFETVKKALNRDLSYSCQARM